MINRNETIDYIKGFAIISVISAHCNAILDSTNKFAEVSSLLLQNIGTLGVICFFVISGILFHYPGKNVRQFLKKKIRNIVIPWFISAICVYLYVYLRKPPITLKGCLNFVLGNGSYCYYLTVLMVLYFLFTLIPFMRKNSILLICEGITVVSSVWFYNIGGVNPYLNLFNWIGYFALGVQISENQKSWEKIKRYISSKSLLAAEISGGYILLLLWQLYHQKGGGYWNGINVVACWIGAISLSLIAINFQKKKDSFIKKVICQSGVDSFGIYIWHMPIAGIVARIMCIGPLNWLVLIRPSIVLLIMLGIFRIVKKIMFKTKIYKCLGYLGLRI